MNILNDVNFLKKLDKDKKIDNEYVEICKKICKLKPEEADFKKQDINKTIKLAKSILLDINPEYAILLNEMLNEENEDNPIIYIYNSDGKKNQSLTCKNQIHFYKENNTKDIYVLLHELTHIIINSRNLSLYKNKEILPILMEFIISDKLGDNSYIISRLNETIMNAKSLLIKNEILNNNFNLDEKIEEYDINNEELEEIEDDILYSKNLDYTDEITYIKGFIYAYYYSVDSIENYKKLIENMKLDTINIYDLIDDIELKLCKKIRRFN